jgi:taurine dioxygenase
MSASYEQPVGLVGGDHVASFDSFTVKPVTPVLSAEISGIQLGDSLTELQVQDIHDALLNYQVIFFRDQNMTRDQQIILGRRFGSLHCHPAIPGPEGYPEILMLHSDEKRQNAASAWHSDVSCDDVPNLGSILYGVEIPESGGDTCFASMYAAYDALSGPMQEFLCGLTAVHESEHVFSKIDDTVAVYPTAEHPLIRTHPETGRQALFVNSVFTTGIKELDKQEAQAVLQFLFRHIETPEFHVRFQWQKNSVAFWDNRCTQHRAIADFFPQTRTMQRVTINGSKPFYRPRARP